MTLNKTVAELEAELIAKNAELAEARRMEAEAARAAFEARRPKQPILRGSGDSAVVRFSRYTGGRAYDFAALGFRDGMHVRWVVTGQETRRFTWAGLLAFIGEPNWPTLTLMTEDRTLGPVSGEEPAAAEVMGNYGRVVRTESLEPHLGKATDGGMPKAGPYAGGF